MNRRTMALKKVTGVFVGLLIVSAGINAWKLIPPYLADFSVKSKIVTSIVEVNDQFLGTDILVPEFVPFEKDPYAYVSVPEYTLVRSRQKGDWDGYVISITPTKLSNSHYYQLMISAQTTDQFSDRELTWEFRDVSHYYRQTQNVTPGRYTKVLGTFQKGPVYYEVSGEMTGKIDEELKTAAIAELQLIIDQMDPVTSVVKENSP